MEQATSDQDVRIWLCNVNSGYKRFANRLWQAGFRRHSFAKMSVDRLANALAEADEHEEKLSTAFYAAHAEVIQNNASPEASGGGITQQVQEQLRKQQEQLQEQVQQQLWKQQEEVRQQHMQLLNSVHVAMNSRTTLGESQTSIGKRVMDSAVRQQLVEVDATATQGAADWLERAGAAGISLKAAMQTSSCVGEAEAGGTQDLFNNLLKATHWPGEFKVHDVHKSTSVCGAFKPDIVVTDGPFVLPSSTVLVLDLKGQIIPYNTPAHICQLAGYGHALLEQLPASSRTCVLLAMSDLRTIQFMRMTRRGRDVSAGAYNNLYSYELSHELPDALAALCAVLLKTSDQLGARPSPQPRWHGNPVTLSALLGMGATSSVYAGQVRVPQGQVGPGQGEVPQGQVGPDGLMNVVAKVVSMAPDAIEREWHALHDLQTSVCLAIPRALAKLDNDQGILLEPQGIPLMSLDDCKARAAVFDGIEDLVTTLQHVHGKGFVHRDIRPDNLLLSAKRLLLIDWGCAVRMDGHAAFVFPVAEFCGTIKLASQAVLEQLASCVANVHFKPEDDLETLVKSLFALMHKQDLHTVLVATDPCDYASISMAWNDTMKRRPMWSALLEAARKGSYGDVSKGLIMKFD